MFEAIAYYVRATRGYGYIFVINKDEKKSGWKGYYQSEKDFEPGFKQGDELEIDWEKKFKEYQVSDRDCEELSLMLSEVSLPLKASMAVGFDGTDYFFQVRSGFTSVTYSWWLDLPEEWKELGRVLAKLEEIIKSEQVSAGNA